MLPGRKHVFIGGLFLLGMSLYGHASFGQTSVPNCEKEPACLALWERASALSKQGSHVDAQRMYEMAYDLRADPRLLFNIARVLHKRGKLPDAASHYESFLRSPVEDPEQKEKARMYLEEIRRGSKSDLLSSDTPSSGEQGPKGPDVTPPSSNHSEPAASDTKPASQPVYKKWWLWTSIALVAGGALAVGLGVGLSRPQREPFIESTWR